MMRRAFTVVAFLSASIFVVIAACFVRQQFGEDHFSVFRWDPSTRVVTDFQLSLQSGGIYAHGESTTALPSDDTSAVQAKAGTSNSRFVHDVSPPTRGSEWPLLWADHYRCTPDLGINRNGLANCWTLEFRCDAALVLFSLCPIVWALPRIRRVIGRRSAAARGFAVIGTITPVTQPEANPISDRLSTG
jgi:hypothetical protein